MAISRDAVKWGYRFFLGRDPESDAAIATHTSAKDTDHLAELLLRSREFTRSERFKDLIAIRQAPENADGIVPVHASTSQVKMLLLGNCQIRALARLIEAMTGDVVATTMELLPTTIERIKSGEVDVGRLVSENDLILVHAAEQQVRLLTEALPDAYKKVRIIPRIAFAAFHPDLDFVEHDHGRISGCLGQYQSALIFYAWKRGLSAAETIELFRDEVFELLGYYAYWEPARALLIREGESAGLPLGDLIDKWSRAGVWMHSINHPRNFVLADVARAILRREGIQAIPGIECFVQDTFADGPVWPVYPEVARRLGHDGSYYFKPPRALLPPHQPVLMLTLEEFVRASFELLSKHREGLRCSRLDSPRYRELHAALATRSTHSKSASQAHANSPGKLAPVSELTNPYRALPDYHFWRRTVERQPMSNVDPITRVTVLVGRTDRVATAGSCFAQHLSRALEAHGLNYYVTERPSRLPDAEALRRNYGVFSARYGNVYTARQLLQLFDRAYGKFVPQDAHWVRPDHRFIDPFRPQIEPDGFETTEALESSRTEHFAAVRQMMETLDILVFTLGLTEAWRSTLDGAIFPLAPGVAGGEMREGAYEFVNFNVAQVVDDMQKFIARLLNVNPHARMLLTVSPVPLIATYENRHVLVSNTYSKAALRVAAEEITRAHSMCDYFPSFEIITGNHARGSYFDGDLRSIRPEGVEHVMRLFIKHYSQQQRAEFDPDIVRELSTMNSVVCDEQAIDPNDEHAVSMSTTHAGTAVRKVR
jgi:hypothetical protein